jgi:hypothetical protein
LINTTNLLIEYHSIRMKNGNNTFKFTALL